MTVPGVSHHTVREWGERQAGGGGFTARSGRRAARGRARHPLASATGPTSSRPSHDRSRAADGRRDRRARLQPGDPAEGRSASPDESTVTVRERLVHMLDMALGLGLASGQVPRCHRQAETLLDILIAPVRRRLLAEVRRGLPRLYHQHARTTCPRCAAGSTSCVSSLFTPCGPTGWRAVSTQLDADTR